MESGRNDRIGEFGVAHAADYLPTLIEGLVSGGRSKRRPYEEQKFCIRLLRRRIAARPNRWGAASETRRDYAAFFATPPAWTI